MKEIPDELSKFAILHEHSHPQPLLVTDCDLEQNSGKTCKSKPMQT